MALIVNFSIANAETVSIPEWVFTVHNFWIEEKISDDEFTTLLNYLEKQNIVDLILHKSYDVKTNFLLSMMQNQDAQRFVSCSDGWYVTGYFVPVEKDYSDEFIIINIGETQREFRQDFVDAIKIEGWGKTLSGDYLGWYDNSFHINETALDQNGQPLVAGMIAVDNTIIDRETELIISTLPEPWNEIILISADEGPAIKGKHIDLFTGEGKLAENETFRVTGYDNKVCK
ncbi:3D domain-containing protein [Nitrosopumilus adriaticus]|uniref:3D domain-containing protein n=1 Tax=Nitrosopumilus adriaticus TaxID=1580092 RepID=UPI00352D5FF3